MENSKNMFLPSAIHHRLNPLELCYRIIYCTDGRWMELAKNRVHWRALVLVVFSSSALNSLLNYFLCQVFDAVSTYIPS
jgi:hypothetical protein